MFDHTELNEFESFHESYQRFIDETYRHAHGPQFLSLYEDEQFIIQIFSSDDIITKKSVIDINAFKHIYNLTIATFCRNCLEEKSSVNTIHESGLKHSAVSYLLMCYRILEMKTYIDSVILYMNALYYNNNKTALEYKLFRMTCAVMDQEMTGKYMTYENLTGELNNEEINELLDAINSHYKD